MLGKRISTYCHLAAASLVLISCGKEKTDENNSSPSEDEFALAQQFERPPLLATISNSQTSVTFIGLHAKPEQAEFESGLLDRVIQIAKSLGYPNDVVIVGDLNLDCNFASQSSILNLPILSQMKMIISNETDTTTGASDCAYDRAMTNTEATATVLQSGANAFSDHHPIAATVPNLGRICAWNAQRLSNEKVAENSGINDASKEFFQRCDITFLQEIIDAEAAESLAEYSGLNVKLSPKLGKTSYKECYALVERDLLASNFRILGTEPGEGTCRTEPVWKNSAQPTDTEADTSQCGTFPYKTTGGYCYATKAGKKTRVANSCCP